MHKQRLVTSVMFHCYYNENEPAMAAWLRELIKDKIIAPGDVDDRSIKDVQASDLLGYSQCHFFAGLGGWSYALKLAKWPEEKEVWTGSCPCQPFSQAGKRKGTADERHLWPDFFRLISERNPSTIFGEQVDRTDGRKWLARVRADLETREYAVGCANLCAAGEAAPHLRQRYFFVGDSIRIGFRGEGQREIAKPKKEVQGTNGKRQRLRANARSTGVLVDAIPNTDSQRCLGEHSLLRTKEAGRNTKEISEIAGNSQNPQSSLSDSNGNHGFWWSGPLQDGWNTIQGEVERGGRKYRAQWRIKPGVPLLAYGIPGRVHLIRGFGNAIVPQVAAKFVRAFMESNPRSAVMFH